MRNIKGKTLAVILVVVTMFSVFGSPLIAMAEEADTGVAEQEVAEQEEMPEEVQVIDIEDDDSSYEVETPAGVVQEAEDISPEAESKPGKIIYDITNTNSDAFDRVDENGVDPETVIVRKRGTRGAMLKAAPTSNITVTVEATGTYVDSGDFGQGASKFKVVGSDSAVFCASVGRRFAGSPTGTTYIGDSARLTFRLISDQNIRKVLWYGWGGPESILSDSRVDYQITHFTVAYYDGTSTDDYYLPTGGAIATFRNRVAGLAAPPDDFYVYEYFGSAETGDRDDGQNMVTWVYESKGNFRLKKTSANKPLTEGNGCYSLEGAEYKLTLKSDSSVSYTLTTDENGVAEVSDIPKGEYSLKETKASQGYYLDQTTYTVNVVSASERDPVELSVTEVPKGDPASMIVKKLDKDTGKGVAQGDGSLAGAVFEVKYYATLDSSKLNASTLKRTWRFTTNANGFANYDNAFKTSDSPSVYLNSETNAPELPIGTITVQEVTPPVGYTANTTVYTYKYDGSNTIPRTTVINPRDTDENVIRGGFTFSKKDYELNRVEPQGSATLKGAVFQLINRSEHPVSVGGREYAAGAVISEFETGANGSFKSSSGYLPYGTYELKEKTPPAGYLMSGKTSATFSIREAGKLISADAADKVKRGGVGVSKWDMDSDSPSGQGNAVLSGAVFEIISDNSNPVLVNGEEYEKGQAVMTLTTNSEGSAGSGIKVLPVGSYIVREAKAPEGYVLNDTERRFTISDDGEYIHLEDDDTAFRDEVIRGGIYIEKWDSELMANAAQGGATLEGAVFEITNKSRASVYVDGSWFEPGEVCATVITDENGQAETPPDLLPYGDYEITEVRAPKGYKQSGVLTRSFSIRADGEKVRLDDEDTAIINDIIRCDFAGVKIAGQSQKRFADIPFELSLVRYTDEGKTEHEVIESHVIWSDPNGEISSASSFAPHSMNTNMGSSFEDGIWFGEISALDDSKGALVFGDYILKELPCERNVGYSLVSISFSVYREKMIDLGTINDEKIEIRTSAGGRDGQKEIKVSRNVVIIDRVRYSHLTPGQEYEMMGTLVYKETGEPVIVEGRIVTASKTFVPDKSDGITEVVFEFNGLELHGRETVVTESLYEDGVEVATHFNLDDSDQTVRISQPVIGTRAHSDEDTKDLYVSGKTVLRDTVRYSGLEKGETYTIKGILMDKEKGSPVEKDGTPVTAETMFTASAENGEMEVVFEFDSVSAAGRKLVVFESLYCDGTELAVHADINDEGQTVTVKKPEIQTTATGADGRKDIASEGTAVLKDRVVFRNIRPGVRYILEGCVVDKETGGKLGSKRVSFVPDKEEGMVYVDFLIDTAELAGRELVCFEKLLLDNSVIAVHEDINDSGQTVKIGQPSVPSEPYQPRMPKTGDDNNTMLYLILLAGAGGALIGTGIYLSRKRKSK